MTNWQLIATLAALVFAIFGANWMNQRQTEKLVEEMGRRFDAALQGLRGEMKAELQGLRGEIKAELSALSQKVDRIARQLDALYKPSLPRGGD